ncbi:hypothetical protein EV356DRAFT_499618 [Viridothelium virens]|uniref:tRNA (guanine(9)-N1)-methyltransferase n=1 Tax=Viridothelium virens TaxID=1048519 RepID=A0A6A6HN61_VIRVR|nr:hypothetical protein EV356DRAFT_499618 [Viridothelium virens]
MADEEHPSKVRKLSHDRSEGIPSERIDSQGIVRSNPATYNSISHEGAQIDQPTLLPNPRNSGEGDMDGTVEGPQTDMVHINAQEDIEDKPLSKNQRKKLLKKQRWEEGRTARKIKRKEKAVEKKKRDRASKATQASDSGSSIPKPKSKAQNHDRTKRQNLQLPVTIILDCSFDDLMTENERISLGSQITRCYSDNRNARLKAHLAVSSWGGFLKERFDNLLRKTHESWRGMRWIEGDFVEASERAREWMQSEEDEELDGALLKHQNEGTSTDIFKQQGEIIYLSSESDNTLRELKPYSTYIIGGLVDKNRHKGICYKRAMDRGIKTARLPIGDFMTMNSRKILATNHVAEIMLKWLESGDWGEAFLQVMPKRKGGQLKDLKASQKAQIMVHESNDDDCGSDDEALKAGSASSSNGNEPSVVQKLEEVKSIEQEKH